MRKVFLIAAREYKAAVKTKSFVIGIVLMPIMMGGGFLAQALLGDQVDPRPKHFAIVDRTPGQKVWNYLKEKAEEHNKEQKEATSPTMATFVLEDVPRVEKDKLPETRLALSERIRKGELTGFLEIGSDITTPLPIDEALAELKKQAKLRKKSSQPLKVDPKALALAEPFLLRYQTNRPSYQDFTIWAESNINTFVSRQRALDRKVTEMDIKQITARVLLLPKGLTTRNPRTGDIEDAPDQNPLVAMLLPFGLIILMFMMVLMGAAPLLQGVMEEKMQRIAEVMLGSVQPFPLMMGKIIGMALVSLTMTAIYLAGVLWAVNHYGYGEYLSAPILIWFLLYQVLALFMFGSLYAAVGAACSDLKEAQAMLMPISLVSIIPLFVWLNVVKEPTSTFSAWISFFPLFTPMLMTARVAVPPGIPIWQPLLGVLLVLMTTTFCVYAAGRIFRVGILLQGKAPRFADLWRWVFRG